MWSRLGAGVEHAAVSKRGVQNRTKPSFHLRLEGKKWALFLTTVNPRRISLSESWPSRIQRGRTLYSRYLHHIDQITDQSSR